MVSASDYNKMYFRCICVVQATATINAAEVAVDVLTNTSSLKTTLSNGAVTLTTLGSEVRVVRLCIYTHPLHHSENPTVLS